MQKDPIKIIHKFKNNNRRIQYRVYIYIGSHIPENIINVLEAIKDKDLYTSLNTISKDNYSLLENYYGKFWYYKIFLSYHIESQINIIHNNSVKHKTLESKYGKEWYKLHIVDNGDQSKLKKVAYSFSAEYYNYLLLNNKIKSHTKKMEMDFRTYNQKIITNENNNQEQVYVGGGGKSEIGGGNSEIGGGKSEIGGGNSEIDSDEEVVDPNTETDKDNNDDSSDIDEIITETQLEEEVEEEINLDDLTKLYVETNIENNKTIKETTQLISDAINNKKWSTDIDKDNHKVKHDNSLDNLTYDVKIEDIYKKIYITDQYIYMDDTIKTMRNKITMSISLHEKFGSIKLLPEAQYFWSEYMFENKPDNVMIGQKWVRRNELLKIDIKPNENLKIYEKLRNNLAYLKDSFGSKIKREDDETNIVRYYNNYITMNEIFMLDIYNELGANYNPDQEDKKNLYDVFINIYYPMISYDRLEQIIQLLSGKNTKESEFITNSYSTIKIDNKIETEIENTIEEGKMKIFTDKNKFKNYFAENYIIQSIIHVNINNPKNITGTTSEYKFNLYRIFDNFVVNDDYPFIQYQTPDSQLTYKFYTKSDKIENQDLLSKWFENAPYGISFKIKISKSSGKIRLNDKYLSINLHETGRIEYKITWKEEDEATVVDINETYNYVRDLLKKINSENKKIKFILPDDDRFKYAFINTIQKFTIPEAFKIDHNDLSEFSRFFYPYISLVIEPKKRKALADKDKNEEVSKYGTYLRYKRISKYDNRMKMHMRILYFLRNYELSDRELVDEIAKQFNITIENSAKELDYVREKYSKVIRRSSKMIKKLKTMPKSKPPGIGIDIQGRDRDKYKIRITGARDKDQLDEIITFMKVLIYLYTETYLYKKKEYQKIKEMLKNLTKIARRRNKVSEIVEYDASIKTVKSITGLDKDRLGFKPDKGQNQWTRSCQNSGNDKKRRPDITPQDQLAKLLADGYKLNNKTGYYEKNVEMKIKGKMYKTIIKAVKLSNADNTYNFYSCDPEQNQEHMYIGFLARGNNPSDLCMPCCFKKDQLTSGNKEKKSYFLKCIGEGEKNNIEDTGKQVTNNLGDKVYILQDTNKIQEGRFIYLSKYLDVFFNKLWKNDQKIKNHYLIESKSGYFFKYTVKHDYYFFLVAIANIYDITIETIIDKIIKFLENDKDNRYFTYLNNGDIAESFKERKFFIDYIKSSNYLEYDLIGELIAIPGLLTKNGINFYILNKQVSVIKKALEKESVKERFYLECLNLENYYQINKNDVDIIILIKEDKYYFPIYRVQRDEKVNKKILLQKHYNISANNDISKILDELRNYHNKSCNNNLINELSFNSNLIAKNIIEKIKVVKQYIDDRKKCKYLELESGLLLPTIPSGISYEYPFAIVRNIKLSWLSLNETIKSLNKINNILDLGYIPKTVFYDRKIKHKINIISILLDNELIIPIKNEMVDESKIKKLALSVQFQTLEETINQEILKYDNKIIYDDRMRNIKEHNYKSEAYNLYRLELSLYLSYDDDTKEKIITIVRNSNIDIKDKKYELRRILFDIMNRKLNTTTSNSSSNSSSSKIKNIKTKKGGAKTKDTFIVLSKELPDLKDYIINNVRDYCEINTTKDKCLNNLHCAYDNNKCRLQLLDSLAVDFVNKVIEELLLDSIKFKEIIQESSYYVSDIVDYTQYTYRSDQKIIKTSNFNITKLMSELFGKDKIPIIGKRQIMKSNQDSLKDQEEEYPELIELGKQLIQPIIPNKDSIIRAYVNSYYWINNQLYDVESRNLGYTSEFQTNLTYLFKANIIDYIQNIINKVNINSDIKKYLEKYFKDKDNFFDSALNKFRKTSFNTDGRIELFILSYLIPIPIVVYDNYSNVKYIFLQGELKVTDETIKNFTNAKNLNKTIFLKFDYDNSSTIPKNIYSIYYQ
jgi:hypothetical protein